MIMDSESTALPLRYYPINGCVALATSNILQNIRPRVNVSAEKITRGANFLIPAYT